MFYEHITLVLHFYYVLQMFPKKYRSHRIELWKSICTIILITTVRNSHHIATLEKSTRYIHAVTDIFKILYILQHHNMVVIRFNYYMYR